MTDILRLEDVKVHFGGVKAVDGVTISAPAGRVTGLVGPNGSGKTTIINAVAGQYALTAGQILLDGAPVSGRRADQIYRLGLARTFQGLRLIPDLSVRDNILAGVENTSRGRRDRRTAAQATDAAIERLGLTSVVRDRAGRLPYGTQRRVEIARAVAAQPRLILLDEPVAGMNRAERDEIATVLHGLRADGMSMVVVEHDLRFVLDLSDHLIVMNFGRVLADGEPKSVAARPEVEEAYLGQRRTRP